MSNPLAALAGSVIAAMQADADERIAASQERVVQARTQLIHAKTENEKASAQLAVAEAVNHAIRENPQIALQLGVIQMANSGMLGSMGTPASHQIASLGSNKSNDDWG